MCARRRVSRHVSAFAQPPRGSGTRGACCERVRDNYKKELQVQQHVIRPHTPLTADWLRLVHASLDYKAARPKLHPAPSGFSRCCMKHEGGYPVNWAELKGEIISPLFLKHAAHVMSGLPPKPAGNNYRDKSEDNVKGMQGKPAHVTTSPSTAARRHAPVHHAAKAPAKSSIHITSLWSQFMGSLG